MGSEKRVVVVTGAARGIGLAVSQWFLENDCHIVMLDIDLVTLANASAKLDEPRKILAIKCDVSSLENVTSCIAQVKAHWGRIDVLVNNAGVAVFKPLLDTTFEDWRLVMATNLDGVFICSQACAPIMLRHGGGSIVNIASISGLRASTLRVAYGTSKAAVMHLTKQQAAEWGTLGIRVNAVAPGPVETAMAKQVHTPAIRADYHDAIPLGRYGTEVEIANTVGFLSSHAARYINGQVLAVDGGFDATGVGLSTLRKEASGGTVD